jgi:molybdopterin converting factor small subunit
MRETKTNVICPKQGDVLSEHADSYAQEKKDKVEWNGTQQFLIYVDNVDVQNENRSTIKRNIANHPGMNNRPVEAAVLRRQSHPIIANLLIYHKEKHNTVR